ncbi:glycosyltransferase family 39 protein [Rickettsiales bacterium]|nr:glycosyltransferase family 39 protein [Rickettsiales bacterium]
MTNKRNLLSADQYFWLFALVILSLRMGLLYNSPFDLFYDEAQYWGWSKSFEFGYYSKPPVVAWMIGLTTGICSDETWCVRLSSPILHIITSWAIFSLTKLVFEEKIALLSSVTYLTLPAVTISSMFVSTDPALLCFWALSLWAFIAALKDDKWRYWILAGIFSGLGMMSKYNMLIFLVSVCSFCFFIPQYRKVFISKKFWSAILIAAVIFVPNIWWNWQNDFASFLHTQDNAKGEGMSISLPNMLEFIASQNGVFGPILFISLLIILFLTATRRIQLDKAQKMLLCFFLPMFLLITSISLTSRAHANWAAPAYISAVILVVSVLYNSKFCKLIYVSLILHLLILAIISAFYPLIDSLGLKLYGRKTQISENIIKDPFRRLMGWEQLGQKVSQIKAQYPEAGILTYTRKTHAELLYYVRPHPQIIVKWNPQERLTDHYDMTGNLNEYEGKDFLFVTQYDLDVLKDIPLYFQSSRLIDEVVVDLYPDFKRHYYIFMLKGFRGYGTK